MRDIKMCFSCSDQSGSGLTDANPRTRSTPVIIIEAGLGGTPGECHSQPHLDADNQEKA